MASSAKLSRKENLLRAIRFETPDYIPMTFHINEACYDAYDPDALFSLMEQHPFLFPDFHAPETCAHSYALNVRKDFPYKDDFGCVWETTVDGIVGTMHKHPLADWKDYGEYRFPDPDKSNGLQAVDWQKFRGRTCVDLDIDRQLVTPFGTPEQIDGLIREEVQKVGCKEGGLTMIYGLYPGVPLENVKAVMDAMERYAFYYSE